MNRRQTVPPSWLIVTSGPDGDLWRKLRQLPRGSGVLLIHRLTARERRQLRHLASLRQLVILAEAPRAAARVHNVCELTRAKLRRPTLILISPLHPTSTHPEWSALPRMRAATLARLAGRRAIALGGMNPLRYAKVARLGFIGWAGISAWLKFTNFPRSARKDVNLGGTRT